MKFSQLLALTCVILMHTSRISAQSSDFYLTLDTTTAAPDEVVCLNLRVNGFYKIITFQSVLTWNQNVVDFDHVENLQLPGWTALDFWHINNKCLMVSWTDPTSNGVSLPDGDTIAHICFKTLSMPDSVTDVSLSNGCAPPGSGSHEAYNAYAQNVWNSITFGNGQIIITSTLSAGNKAGSVPSFTLQPNPTHSFSSVLVDIPYVGAGQIQVSNLSGQLIWKEAVQCQPGQNRFDIPAWALKQPGLYQVSLITDKGIITRRLCVTSL